MIKLHNLDPSLTQWIMTVTGMGLGLGKVFWVAPATSATSQYRSWLESMGVSSGDIFTLPSLAYASCVAYRNDVVMVLPGTYTETETLTWAKAETHMFGTGNPNWRQGGKCRVETTTIGVAATIDVTASGVAMGGLNITNSGADAANLTALRLSSTYFHGSKLDIRGLLADEVEAIEGASCLEFAAVASSGFGSTFKDCNIGTMSGTVRTATGAACNGVIYFATPSQNGSPGAYVEFDNCRILSRCEAAGGAMVKVLHSNWGIDRLVWFNDCLFANFWLDYADNIDGAFYCDDAGAPASGKILLTKCDLAGVDQWQTQDNGAILSTMPVVGVGGGIEVEPTAGTGT